MTANNDKHARKKTKRWKKKKKEENVNEEERDEKKEEEKSDWKRYWIQWVIIHRGIQFSLYAYQALNLPFYQSENLAQVKI